MNYIINIYPLIKVSKQKCLFILCFDDYSHLMYKLNLLNILVR